MQPSCPFLRALLALTSMVHTGPIAKLDPGYTCYGSTPNSIQASDWWGLADDFYGNGGSNVASFPDPVSPDPIWIMSEAEAGSKRP
jgi:hypothetical protein